MTFQRGDLVRPKALRAQYRVREVGGNKVLVFNRRGHRWCHPDDLIKILTFPNLRSN